MNKMSGNVGQIFFNKKKTEIKFFKLLSAETPEKQIFDELLFFIYKNFNLELTSRLK